MLISHVLDAKGHGVATLLPGDTVGLAVRTFAERGIGAVVVQDLWQRMQGVFSERDLVRLLAKEGAGALDRLLADVLTRAVITCRPTDRIESALAVMTANKVRHLPVLEAGKLAGIVSIGDLVKYRLDEKALEADVLLEIARLRGAPAGASAERAPHA